MEIESLLKILLAAVLGGMIGLEREISNKEAGLRTNILIAVGSCLVTILSFKFTEISQNADPSRLASQIITGVGFLGAGAIIQARHAVQGLTTAATIWTVGAIGIAVGIGLYLVAFLVTVFIIAILGSFKMISSYFEYDKKLFSYILVIEESAMILIEIKKIIVDAGIKHLSSKLIKADQGYKIEIILTATENKNKKFIEKVMELSGVKEIVSENL